MAKPINVPITPDVAVWARTTAGLSVSEAADLLHEAPTVLLAWERGQEKPSLTQAKALARLYRRPLAALLLPDVPVDPATPIDFRRGVAGQARRLTRPILIAIRRARRMQAAAHELFEGLELSAVSLGLDPPSLAPEDAAARFRDRLSVSIAEQLSWASDYDALNAWRSAVERLNVLVLQAGMPVEEVRAFSLAPSSPAVIVLNSGDAPTARIFSLFHELGHLVRGQQGICDPASELMRTADELAEERFCNRFSGALLVPQQAVMHDQLAKAVAANESPESPLGTLASRYKVSRQVMWYRLREVGLINTEVFGAGWAVLGLSDKRPEHERAPGTPFVNPPAWRRALLEDGRGFVSKALEALDRGLVGPADLVDWLEIKTPDIGKLEQQLATKPE